MLFEHIIYSTAIAIIAGMLWYKYTGRDPSWIIIASAFAPDFDIVAGEMSRKLGMNPLINGAPISHGDFHNIAFLLLFASAAALVLMVAGMRFLDSFLFAGIGFGAHMFEDALVFSQGYAFFWPVSGQNFGIGVFFYKPDLYGIANLEVLMVGMIAVVFCGALRIFFEGKGGIIRTARALGLAAAIIIMIIPALNFIDVNVMNKIVSFTEYGYINKWQFWHDASRDSTVFHSGKYSARIKILPNESNIRGVWRSDKIMTKPNTTYNFLSWGKSEGIVGDFSSGVKIAEYNASGNFLNETNLIFSKGTTDWIRRQIKFTTSMNTSNVVVFSNVWTGYGTFWFDDVELYEDRTNNNMIPNGGFEENFNRSILKIVFV